MNGQGRRQQLGDLVASRLEEAGYELIEFKLVPRGRAVSVQILIDVLEPGRGVTVGDCAQVSKLLGNDLEFSDRLPGRHVLEVSSPGMNRPLTRPAHYIRFIGEQAVVTLARARDGRRRFSGTIAEADDRRVVLVEDDEQRLTIAFDEIASAHLKVDPWKPRETR